MDRIENENTAWNTYQNARTVENYNTWLSSWRKLAWAERIVRI